jgi:hypothetical protein
MDELKYKVGIETDRISPEQLIDPEALNKLVELNGQIDSYKAQLKELAEAEKQQGSLSEDQKKQQEQLKLALKDTQNEYRAVQKGIQTVDNAVKSSITTYQGLVNENKALMDAMRNLPLDDTTGELQRLQEQYNANNEKLKEFDASLGNHQRNVGNYGNSLKGMQGQLSALPGPIGKITKAKTLLNVVLNANPFLLIVTAVGLLIAGLSKLQPVVDFATKQWEILTNIFKFAVDKVGAFFGLIEGNNKTLGEIIAKTAALADAEVRLRDAKREQIVLLAEEDKLVSELRLKAADQTLSEQERLDTLVEIEEVERRSLQKKIELAKEELRIAEERAEISHSDAATLEDIANKRAAILNLETETNNFLIRITQRRTGLEVKAIEETKRANEEAHKRRLEQIKKEENARYEAWFKGQEEIRKAEEAAAFIDYIELQIDAEEKVNDLKLALNRQYAEALNNQLTEMLEEQGKFVESAEQQRLIRQQELEQLYLMAGLNEYEAYNSAKEQADLEYESKLKEAKQREIDLEKATQEAKLALAQTTASNLVSIGEGLFGKSKALAVAQAIIDTFGAANNAAKNTPGGVIAKSIAAAAMVAQGLANVRKILSTKPGGGGAGGGGMAAPRPAMSTMAVSPAGNIVSPDFARGQLAGQVATDATSPGMQLRPVQVSANVDRRGLAIAVREGERSIRTQQFDFK